jgi:hypothetical protein
LKATPDFRCEFTGGRLTEVSSQQLAPTLASSPTSSADFRWRHSHAGQVADILAEGHTAIDMQSGQRLEGVVLRRDLMADDGANRTVIHCGIAIRVKEVVLEAPTFASARKYMEYRPFKS